MGARLKTVRKKVGDTIQLMISMGPDKGYYVNCFILFRLPSYRMKESATDWGRLVMSRRRQNYPCT